MDKKIAEFIGVMLGDGNLGKYKSNVNGKIKIQHRIRISLDSKNRNYINYITQLIKDILDVEPKVHYKKKENVADIGIYKKDKFLLVRDELGLRTSPKWNRMKIPKKYSKGKLALLVLRGLFDTDGCLSIFNNNGNLYPRIEIKICSSPAQKQFREMLEEFGFRFTIQNLEKGKIRIRISGVKELKKWFELVGSSNKIHTEKASKFLKESFIS